MHIISLDWSDFKTNIINNGFFINYKNGSNGYEVFCIDRNIRWITTVVTAEDITDFETNYKSNANINICSPRSIYKNHILTTTNDWQELNLGNIYLDFSITNIGTEDSIIKLNDSVNDEIPIVGGAAIRDILELSNFALSKVYYKSQYTDQSTQLRVIVIK